MLVFRGTTLIQYASVVCLLLALTGVHAIDLRKMVERVTPVVTSQSFKEQAKTEALSEATLKATLARTQANLEHENKMLSMQQEEVDLLLKLKALTEQREHAERSLVHQRLVVAQRETARLVSDLAARSKIKMLMDLQKLNTVIAQSLLPHQKPSSIAIDSKLLQKKQAPAAESEDAATPTNGVESDAKKQLHKQLVAKAAEVVDAQLDGILNSEELAYIKAHNELGDSDASETEDGEIKEEDHGANPGETPDEHYKRLSKEADALMAKAYPFIRCEGAGASGGTGAHTGAHSSSTGEHSSTAESSTVESTGGGNSTATAEGSTSETGSATGVSTGGGLLEAGASGVATGATATTTAVGGETPAAVTAEGSSTAETATPPATPPATA